MDIRRAFTTSSYALVLTGILSLSIAEGSPAIIILATGLSLLAYWRAERLGRPIGRLATNLLVLGVVFFLPVDFMFISLGEPVLTITHFLLAVQVVKLFGPKTARDYLQLFSISLMHLGVSAVLTIELAFSAAFLIYMIVGTWTLILFLLVRELDARAPEDPGRVRSGTGLLRGTALVAVMTLALTTVFFFMFPRFSAVIFNVKRHRMGPRVTGFSDEIGLQTLSGIKQDTSVVLRVEVEEKGSRLPDSPKWRGLSFDRYENGNWRRSLQRHVPRPNPLVESRRRDVAGKVRWDFRRPRRPAPPPGTAATYTILQEALSLDSKVLFGVPDVDSVEFISLDRPADVMIDAGDSVLGLGLPTTTVKYRVRSTPPRREAARQAPVPTRLRFGELDYLQLPDGEVTGKIRALAADVIAKAGAATPYAKAEALETYLKSEFEYTLDLESAPAGVDPIEHFLFTTKEGHCELAATAFVLMCRTQGIPARLVNGFQTGEWNELYGYYAVRQAEAHAWAEVLFAGEAGWIDFDPTPWIGAEGSAMSALEKVQDYLRMRWLNYVISYTLSDQLSVAERVRARLQRLREEIGKTVRDLRRALPRLPPKELARLVMAAAGVLAVAVGLGYWLVARRRNGKKRIAAAARRARPVPFFEEMLRLLERRGLRRLPTETAREFAARVAREASLPEPARVAEAFYRVRFGEEELAAADRAEVEAALAAIGGKPLSGH